MMEYQKYFTRERAKFTAICGEVNIPWGSLLCANGSILLWRGLPVCATTSQNAQDHFVQDDDGFGEERGRLISSILSRLKKRNKGYQARWDAVWADEICQKYRNYNHIDFWLWGHDFYNAHIEDLRHISKIIEVIH